MERNTTMVQADPAGPDAFNNTAVLFPFVPVHEQIRRQAGMHPDKTAVICADQRMTFRELDRLSDRIARELIRKKAGKDELIAVLFEREAAVYAAEIGVLKSGAGFLPFIPEYPDDRIDYCMEDSGSRLLITTESLRKKRNLRGKAYEVATVEELLTQGEPSGQDTAFPQVAEEDLAYCIYTSGTTGRPKGVLVEHRNIANYVHRNEKSIEIMHLAEPGRISLAVASFSFDFSLEEEMVPLCNGNTVVIATNEEIHDPVKFAEMVIRTGADAMECTPTYLCGLLAVRESREALKRISLFHIGGEAFPKRLWSMLRELREDSVIMNVYGPTECTIISSVSIVTGEDAITAGRPRANLQYHVFDPSGKELPAGQKGELVISGRQVARGYTSQNDRGGAFFTYRGKPAYRTGDLAAWTDDGEIMLYGRIDSQVKLHGFRIELNEIEAVMAECPEIRSAAVALKKKAEQDYLVGYYTAEETVDRISLKNRMRAKLPYFMVPNVFIRMKKMPLSTNGKIDRKALPEPEDDEIRTQYIPPRSEEEKKLCLAFEKVLRRPAGSVGLMDDFFDLSGDSISAMEVLAEAGIDGLTYADIFTFRTPAEILGEVKKRQDGEQAADLERLERDAGFAPHRLTPVQWELLDVQMMVPRGATVSSIRFLMRLGHTVDPERFRDALNTALANHPGLAMKFFFDKDNELRQQYDPGLVPEAEIREISAEEENALTETLVRPFARLLDHSLCRVNLFRGKRGLYFFIDVHHLLADGFSYHPFFRDIADAYHGKALKKDRYLALLAMEDQNTEAGPYAADREYLLHRYGGYDWCIDPFVADPACGEKGFEFHLPLRFSEAQVREAGERLSVSFSVMHIAAILLAMRRFTGKKDVMAFWTFHNRQTTEADDAVGMFIKTLPVGCHMDEIRSLEELLLSVREQVVSGVAHSAYSYLVEQVFARGIRWIESNQQIRMIGSDMDVFAPEHIELQNPYPDTANNVMLAILSDSGHQENGFDSFFCRVGDGIRAADVERLHRLICEILEAIVLHEPIPYL